MHGNVNIISSGPYPVTAEALAYSLRIDIVDAAETVELNDCIQAATEWAEDLCSRLFRSAELAYTQYGFGSFYLPYFTGTLPTEIKYYDVSDDSIDTEFEPDQIGYTASEKGLYYQFYPSYFENGVFPENKKIVALYSVTAFPPSPKVKRAISLMAGLLYQHREDEEAIKLMSIAEQLLYNDRLSYV